MGTRTLVAGLLLLFISPLAPSHAIDLEDSGKVPSGRQELRDRSKEAACDCCQKCQAAKSPIKPKTEEGATLKDGCKDCCERCGKPLQPSNDIPPEVIDKRIPPEIKDKGIVPDIKDKHI